MWQRIREIPEWSVSAWEGMVARAKTWVANRGYDSISKAKSRGNEAVDGPGSVPRVLQPRVGVVLALVG